MSPKQVVLLDSYFLLNTKLKYNNEPIIIYKDVNFLNKGEI